MLSVLGVQLSIIVLPWETPEWPSVPGLLGRVKLTICTILDGTVMFFSVPFKMICMISLGRVSFWMWVEFLRFISSDSIYGGAFWVLHPAPLYWTCTLPPPLRCCECWLLTSCSCSLRELSLIDGSHLAMECVFLLAVHNDWWKVGYIMLAPFPQTWNQCCGMCHAPEAEG